MKTLERRLARIEDAVSPAAKSGCTVWLEWFGSEVTGATCDGEHYPKQPGEDQEAFKDRLRQEVPFSFGSPLRTIMMTGEPGGRNDDLGLL